MDMLRTNSTVITSLLNTFIHDPLLEWIPSSKQFNMGNLNIGISLVVYDQDRRDHFAATTALQFLHLYLDAFIPRFTELRYKLIYRVFQNFFVCKKCLDIFTW
jgi:phosphatidylinositol kinase/protein kinase (PI-3  family)